MANLDSLSPTAWIVANGIINENQQPIEFRNHRFLIYPFDDMHSDIVVKKSAQVGFSVLAILKSFWLAKYKNLNTIYVLPTQDIVKSFVNPKIDPLIASNDAIQKFVSKDSVTLKQIGDRFIHYKGSASQREAISTSADLLAIDEYDRCMDMNVLNTYDSRLQASEYAWRWRFSNPSAVGFGVDSLFQDSDQRHWFVKCHHCGHRWFMDFEKDEASKAHYVDQKAKVYACGKCHKAIDDADRRNGEWIARFPSRNRHGYWFSQMMAPWVTAERILEQKEESSIDFFYNFVLGKAYTPSDMVVNRETILRACAPSSIPRINVAIGVDQNVSEQIWVAATAQGVFAHGKAKSWEEIEHLKLMYNAVVVCDPAPYSTMPKKMAAKYHDWYLCYFKQMDGMEILQWKDSVVYADRTRLLDTVATEIAEARLLFRERPYELEDYIKDWQNIYRTTVEKEDGRVKSEWLKKEGQLSDFSFATAYCRIGLSRVLGGVSTFIEPQFDGSSAPITDTVTEDGRYQTTLDKAVEDTFERMDYGA
jgi:DNA-directed RNA polymerase subunit RPC12/RpoP